MDKATRPVAVFAAIVSLWLVLVMGVTQATFRPDAWSLPDDDLLGFVEVPPGPFEMGDDADRHILDLPRFFIGRFEVTVGQFRTFVEDDGYALEDARSVRGASDHPVRRSIVACGHGLRSVADPNAAHLERNASAAGRSTPWESRGVAVAGHAPQRGGVGEGRAWRAWPDLSLG